MTHINLEPRRLLERMRDEFPATYRAFGLERVLDALEQETRYTMTEALLEFFRAPQPSSEESKR